MKLRNLTVLGLLATVCWWGASCASGGSDSTCGNLICEVGETSMTCPQDCGGGNCGNTVCEPGEDTVNCASDCYCGNGTCDSGESELTCTLDCLCGDGVCSASESTTSCAGDCYCGNNTCDAGESLASCPTDCTGAPVCGDGTCNGTESAATCPADCSGTYCGDGTCDADETTTSCPADCGGGCTDPVCDLYPQCGCTGGQKCSLDSANNNACISAGSTQNGGSCTADTDCVAGAMCLGRSTTEGQCLGYCDPVTQAGCTSGTSYCLELVDSNQITIPGAGVCTVTCQPHNASAACPSGMGCEIYTHNITDVTFSDCHGNVGTGTNGDSCDNTNGPYCAVGYGCFNDAGSQVCYQWCTMTSTCTGATTCTTTAFDPPITLGGLTYGICL